jgi:hypothetical protein
VSEVRNSNTGCVPSCCLISASVPWGLVGSKQGTDFTVLDLKTTSGLSAPREKRGNWDQILPFGPTAELHTASVVHFLRE